MSGGGIPSRSQIRLLEEMLTLLDCRPENIFCDNHIYNFHVSELPNLNLG